MGYRDTDYTPTSKRALCNVLEQVIRARGGVQGLLRAPVQAVRGRRHDAGRGCFGGGSGHYAAGFGVAGACLQNRTRIAFSAHR
jgi:hypothetical protein